EWGSQADMVNRIAFAMVGCGAVARRHHLPVLSADPRVKVVALCDTDPAQISIVEARFGLHASHYNELAAVLENRAVDVVAICTPGFTHYGYAKECLLAGKHVLLEKPPVYTVAQALDLQELAVSRRLKIGAVLNSRYKPLVRELKNAIEAGALGEIAKIQVVHHANLVFG